MVVASPFPANHGTPAAVLEAGRALAQQGHSVHVVTYHVGQTLPGDAPVEGMAIHRVRDWGFSRKVVVGPTAQKPLLDLLLSIKLCRVIRAEKIDLIHAHNYEGALVGYVAKKWTGRPLLYNAINTMGSELPGYGFIRPRLLAIWLAKLLDWIVPRLADHILVISDTLSDLLVRQGIAPDRITTIPLGVVVEPFMGIDPLPVRARLGVGARPMVIYTGVLDAFQGIDDLLKAMGFVVAACPHAILLIAGTVAKTEDIVRYQAQIEALGLQAHVILKVEQPFEVIPSFLAAANVAVVPRSDCPGFPVKLLNYMAAGKAIVSFKGSAKGLRHMYNGIVVADHCWEKLGEGIVRLIQDPDLAAVLGAHARQGVLEVFHWQSLARGMAVLYDGMMETKRGERIVLDAQQLRQYVKRSYAPIFHERRIEPMQAPNPNARRQDRRQKEEEIAFLERRRMVYK